MKRLNGVSHNPEELALEEDIELAVRELADFLISFQKEKFQSFKICSANLTPLEAASRIVLPEHQSPQMPTLLFM